MLHIQKVLCLPRIFSQWLVVIEASEPMRMRENWTRRRLPSGVRRPDRQYSKSTSSKMAARKRSIVWSFFQAEDDRRVLCLLCMKTVLYFGHTTNMLRHLRTKHPSDFSSLDKRKPATDAVSKRNDSGCVEGMKRSVIAFTFMYSLPTCTPIRLLDSWLEMTPYIFFLWFVMFPSILASARA